MLRATDGHAKNFSIFLQAKDTFRLTPLYDVLSAWPIIGDGPNLVSPHKAKMAMAWLGKNRHYLASSVLKRHMIHTVQKCGYGGSAIGLINETVEQTEQVIEQVKNKLPASFPERLANSILGGLSQASQGLSRDAET
jgi:serine/threonine-protein kinase HipA